MSEADWTACLTEQGIEPAEISSAQQAAQELAAQIETLSTDPFTSVDPASHQVALARQVSLDSFVANDVAAPASSDDAPRTIEEMAAALSSGAISAVELAEQGLARLAQGHASLNILARAETESALAHARAADARIAALKSLGDRPPPLMGIPTAHKDLYMRAGWLMEAGSAILKGNRASITSSAVTALDRAGMTDLGRVNTVEFALGPDGRNVHTGDVRNPWDPTRVTGGSSSASGAAVASGAVPAALGSDTGGSVRLPAAACGVVGVKPTAGLIGRSGVWPLSGSLDTVGPLTQTVRDAALMLQAMSGPDPLDPQSVTRPPKDLLAGIEGGVHGARVALIMRPFFDPVTPEIGAAVEAAAALLAGEGAELRQVDLPELGILNQLNIAITNAEGATQHSPFMATRAAEYGRETLGRLMSGLFLPATTYLAAQTRRAAWLDWVLEKAFGDNQILMTPVWPCDPPLIAGDTAESYHARVQFLGHCTRPFNYLGLPSVVLPCALSAAGLPIAIQLIGRPFSEDTLLRTARAYERARAFREDHRPAVLV
ncbi:MAG: amidase [Pseudomonadota bacterium]